MQEEGDRRRNGNGLGRCPHFVPTFWSRGGASGFLRDKKGVKRLRIVGKWLIKLTRLRALTAETGVRNPLGLPEPVFRLPPPIFPQKFSPTFSAALIQPVCHVVYGVRPMTCWRVCLSALGSSCLGSISLSPPIILPAFLWRSIRSRSVTKSLAWRLPSSWKQRATFPRRSRT